MLGIVKKEEGLLLDCNWKEQNVNILKSTTICMFITVYGISKVRRTLVDYGRNVMGLCMHNNIQCLYMWSKDKIIIIATTLLLQFTITAPWWCVCFSTSCHFIIISLQWNDTPLQLALRHDHRDIVQCMVKEAKVDTTQLDEAIIYYFSIYNASITMSSVPFLFKLADSARHCFVETHMASQLIIHAFCCD